MHHKKLIWIISSLFTDANRDAIFYHICFCQYILATIDIPNEMHELRIERSVNIHGLLRVSLPNEMRHTIRKLNSTDRKGT